MRPAAFEIKTKDRQDLREELAKRSPRRAGAIRRLDLRRASLEDVYTAVVCGDGSKPATCARPRRNQ